MNPDAIEEAARAELLRQRDLDWPPHQLAGDDFLAGSPLPFVEVVGDVGADIGDQLLEPGVIDDDAHLRSSGPVHLSTEIDPTVEAGGQVPFRRLGIDLLRGDHGGSLAGEGSG